LRLSLAGKALEQGRFALEIVDIRQFASNKHRSVDDTPAGGGPGMVLKPDVVGAAIDEIYGRSEFKSCPLWYLSARGKRLTQTAIADLAKGPGAVLLCGRYEGVDQRVIEARGAEEMAVADVVLSGGEIAAMLVLDAAVRLLPGVMGKAESADEESFSSGLLEYPQFTRPQVWEGHEIPAVLNSGNHAAIAAWRREQALKATAATRPDLWALYREKAKDRQPKKKDEE
jgi:tRNA (guanine37-N1)-methyltransferase